MENLANYLETNNLTQTDFATLAGVKQATISRILSLKKRPSLELAVHIEQVTDGAVPATSWVDDAENVEYAQ